MKGIGYREIDGKWYWVQGEDRGISDKLFILRACGRPFTSEASCVMNAIEKSNRMFPVFHDPSPEPKSKIREALKCAQNPLCNEALAELDEIERQAEQWVLHHKELAAKPQWQTIVKTEGLYFNTVPVRIKPSQCTGYDVRVYGPIPKDEQ